MWRIGYFRIAHMHLFGHGWKCFGTGDSSPFPQDLSRAHYTNLPYIFFSHTLVVHTKTYTRAIFDSKSEIVFVYVLWGLLIDFNIRAQAVCRRWTFVRFVFGGVVPNGIAARICLALK